MVSKRTVHKRHEHLWIAVTAFGVATILLSILVIGSIELPLAGNVITYLALSIILLGVGLAGIRLGSVSRRIGKFDILELPVWYTLWTLVSLVLFGFFVFVDDPKYRLPSLPSVDWVASGLWLLVVGLSGLWLGYCGAWRLFNFRSFTGRRSITREPSVPLLWAFYGLIWLERLWRIHTVGTVYGADVTALGDLSVLNQFLNYLEESTYLIVAITALQVFRHRWTSAHLKCILALEIIFVFLTGMMKPVLWLGLVLLALMHYSARPLRFTRAQWLLLIMAGLILIPIAIEYRVLISTGSIDNRSVVSLLKGLTQAFHLSWGQGPSWAMEMLADKVILRQAMVASTLGEILYLTPSVIPYWGLGRLLSIPLYIIPRAIWPEKPFLSQGVYFGILYLGSPSDTNSSAAFTVFGDLYLSAGWPTVFLGMAILGVVAALLYRYLKVQPLQRGDISLTALYIALAVSMADIEGSYVGVMVGLVHRVLVFGLIFWLLHLRVVRNPISSGCDDLIAKKRGVS